MHTNNLHFVSLIFYFYFTLTMLAWTTIMSAPLPTIPMLRTNCCYNVILFYVGNRRCCIVLYCTGIVLYCIVLYCIVLYCIVLYCIVLYCIVLYCIVLYCIVLYCIIVFFTSFPSLFLPSIFVYFPWFFRDIHKKVLCFFLLDSVNLT